jgi:hypothetical protein
MAKRSQVREWERTTDSDYKWFVFLKPNLSFDPKNGKHIQGLHRKTDLSEHPVFPCNCGRCDG